MSTGSDSSESAVERAIDDLYRTPLDTFTAQRNALAANLKKAGDRENADRVKALAKPGVAAWAVNQAYWRDPNAVQALLDAGEELRRAHVSFAHGKAADIRAAVEARQQAVDGVIDRALDALGGTAKVAADLRHRIAVTIEALASSGVPDGAALGRLTTDLQSSGFEALSALAAGQPAPPPEPVSPSKPVLVKSAPAPVPSKPAGRELARAEQAEREREKRLADAKTRLANTEAALREAAKELKEAAGAAEKARTASDRAADEVSDLEQRLDEARERARDGRRILNEASQAASQAEMTHARTARDLEKAREVVRVLADT
jgi:DNA repair exonuclease SbcCD ATPase subunit